MGQALKMGRSRAVQRHNFHYANEWQSPRSTGGEGGSAQLALPVPTPSGLPAP